MANASASHVFVSGIADDAASQAAGEVLPSHWNAVHTIAAGGSTTEVQVNSGGAIVGSPFFTADSGQMAIGNASALGGGSLYGNYPPIIIDIEATYTVDPPSGFLQGLVSYIRSDFGAPSTASVYGLFFTADNSTANPISSLYGVTGIGRGNATDVAIGGSFIGEATAGSPTQTIGAYCYAANTGLGTPALAAGLFVDSTINSGGGSITNVYGIAVDDQTSGINNWSIKTGLGKVQFGDNLILGTVSSKTGVLQLANASSANLTSIQAGNAAAAVTYTWPTNVGAAGTFLKDAAGNGTLSWAVPTAALTLANPYSQDSGSSAEIYFEYTNNTPGSMRFGLASGSGAGGIFTATTNNASVFGSHTNHLVEFYQNDTKRLTISSTAITSTLPIVGNLTGNADTVTVAAEGADTSCSILFSTATSGSLGPKTHADMTFNASTGVATFGQPIAGSITGNAATVSSANEATDTTCFPLFITASGTQTLATKNNTLFTFNSSTVNLGASGVTLGANSGALGTLKLFGNTSGDVTIKPAAAAGTATVFQVPATNGNSGEFLQTNGSGVTSWAAASGGGAPSGFILGMTPQWTSTTVLGASAGIVYIESLATTISGAPADITPSSPSASTWYHIYVYSNAGTPTLEASTTAPVAFATPIGTARSKSGDTSRRYLYSARTNASNVFYSFLAVGSEALVWMRWVTQNLGAAPFRVASNIAANTSQTVSCGAVVPTTSRLVNLRTVNNLAANYAYWSGVSPASATSYEESQPDGTTTKSHIFPFWITCDTSQNIYVYSGSVASGIYADVPGYIYER